MTHAPIRVAIADDHPVVRLSVEAALDDIPMVSRIGSVGNSSELMELLEHRPCDVLVTDYAMPGGSHGDGLDLLCALRARFPAMGIVVLTAVDDPFLIQALITSGIVNILSKVDGIAHIGPAVQAAHVRRRYVSPSIANLVAPFSRARPKLSRGEAEVLALYMAGVSINEIAERLQKRKQTISTQKSRAMEKLGIASDADLFKHAAEVRRMASIP
ncbi:response regulator transcription factor [Dyella sp. EPa41]|uniref:response regulator transcription factor n=1 Tax=Dyella sp. EPa41 TaxID=1561194 RepID=UPI00191594A4|nr:response regulator transcription factor [Dyella sp. EPa41]